MPIVAREPSPVHAAPAPVRSEARLRYDSGTKHYNLAEYAEAKLGGFSLSPNVTLPVKLGGSAAAVIGDSIYLFGGTSESSPTNGVYRAPIAADDSIGAFVAAGITLPAAVGEHALVVTPSSVFVMGGYSGGMPVNTIFEAPIAADGTVGAFVVPQTTFNTAYTLTTARRGLRALVVGDIVCTMGGFESGASDFCECGNFTGAGKLNATFRPLLDYNGNSNYLITPRAYFAVSYYDGTMAVYGGSPGVTTVETTVPAFDSFLHATRWVASSMVHIPQTGANQPALLVGSSLYILGTSLVADLDAFVMDFMSDVAAALVEARMNAVAVLVGNQAYVIGGDGSLSVEQVRLK